LNPSLFSKGLELQKLFFFIIIILFLSIDFPNDISGERDKSLEKYHDILDFYYKWQEDLFDLGTHHRRELKYYLWENVSELIKTDADYMLVMPDSFDVMQVTSVFKKNRWLKFHGPVDIGQIKESIKKNPHLLLSWWRSKKYLIVSGRIKRVGLGRDAYGDTVEIHLETIHLSEE
jgi:hypothetical protein